MTASSSGALTPRNTPPLPAASPTSPLTGETGRYLVVGDLSFHGQTRTFEHDMSIEFRGGTAIAMKGDYVFDIREFGMKPPSMLMLKVYPQVAVRVELHGHVVS